jgi:hypothetical protein
MNTKIVLREELEEAINEVFELPVVKSGQVFIAGVTKGKDYNGKPRMILEIVQSKKQVANSEDSKFKSTKPVRVWFKATKEGFDYLFHSLTVRDKNRLTGAELQEKTAKLQGKEILGVFTKIKTINVEGEEEIPTISVKQYSAEAGLPKKISDILNTEEDERTEAQIADLKLMTMVTIDEQETLVDEYGNQVYEINTFTYGDDEDIYLKKMPISEYYNYVFDMKNILSDKKQSSICKFLSKNESFIWTSELIEKYDDKWDWSYLSENNSVPWTLKLINKYADKLSCSESIWNTLKPYIDDELIEEVFKKIEN